jgi:crotonobetainyl-CoA:carnitine CoA-transferase CaiB-like acyl-CoA transferase
VDQIAQGMGGLMSITGIPGQGPVRVGIPIADLCSGIFLAQGILVALIERETTGEGKWVHTSLLEAMLSMLDFQASRWLMSHEVPPQAGNNHPTGIPTGVFETKDGHINIAAAGDDIYHRFCRAIERPDLITDARFATSKARSTNRDTIMDVIMPVTRQKTSAEWIKLLNDAGVPAGRSTRSTSRSPIRRCSICRWRSRFTPPCSAISRSSGIRSRTARSVCRSGARRRSSARPTTRSSRRWASRKSRSRIWRSAA